MDALGAVRPQRTLPAPAEPDRAIERASRSPPIWTKRFCAAKTCTCVKLEGAMDFDTWYSGEYTRVLAAVALVCGGGPHVEDATTDAFVKAFERWETVGAMGSPTGWVTRVAINKARRSFRRSARLDELLNTERLAAVFSDTYEDADVVAALAQLTYRQRRAVVLHHLQGFSQAEVATEMGVATGTASATLTQARKKLRVHLNPTKELTP